MRHLFLAVVLALPVPVFAGSFNPPAGCTTFMTVQARQCRVSNHYKCSADTPGDQWRADFDQQGPFFLSRINYEAEWVESYDLGDTAVRQTLGPDPSDPASFTELLSTGTDTFAFNLSRDNGEQTRVNGFDTLTGRSFTIDGVTLAETQFEFTETDQNGVILRQSRGNEYIHPEMRLFFSGPSEWRGPDGDFLPMDGSPIQFIFPDEPGFAATEPLFDCDPLMTRAAPSQKDSSHDQL
ncbi:MAG: hypothetical protein U0934_18375 [Pseudotabrizicola sp.]|uniref:hypothetical protein n=1 Tax=Pseudotabrizicola sp. TaxID=2939647 RepID=UPI002715D640|nr:hypothetical protein [Pseudotabrizicola sp.]MDO8884348.1 hypothetical protein [Pseudotabrizicola sp.]MDP2083307.1 hypothetical protein [Pseudotabrizicola sp.]MDZ7575890.1 hypothetical protein [Pseudotabrizicola sp.]